MNLDSFTKAITDFLIGIANIAAGQASVCGTYQPKEPECIKKTK